jgi:hypothetical protein
MMMPAPGLRVWSPLLESGLESKFGKLIPKDIKDLQMKKLEQHSAVPEHCVTDLNSLIDFLDF